MKKEEKGEDVSDMLLGLGRGNGVAEGITKLQKQ